jgi:hypothetical protein
MNIYYTHSNTSYMFRPLMWPSSERCVTKNKYIEMLQKICEPVSRNLFYLRELGFSGSRDGPIIIFPTTQAAKLRIKRMITKVYGLYKDYSVPRCDCCWCRKQPHAQNTLCLSTKIRVRRTYPSRLHIFAFRRIATVGKDHLGTEVTFPFSSVTVTTDSLRSNLLREAQAEVDSIFARYRVRFSTAFLSTAVI